LVRQLLEGSEVERCLPKQSGIEKNRSFQRVAQKISKNTPMELVQKVFFLIVAMLWQFIRNWPGHIINREILPMFVVGKRFEYGPHDQMTQMGSGKADAYIFSDEVEVEAHKSLFKTTNVYLAQ
jgi:hypothetical protein